MSISSRPSTAAKTERFLNDLQRSGVWFVGCRWPLMLGCVIVGSVVWNEHQQSVQQTRVERRARLQGYAEEERQWEAEREDTAQRWWAIKFYASTVYEPGDFPARGFYRDDGTQWTPEEGGLCFNAAHELVMPHLDLDPEADPSVSSPGSLLAEPGGS